MIGKFERHANAPFDFTMKAVETKGGDYVSMNLSFLAPGSSPDPFDPILTHLDGDGHKGEGK